MRLAFVLAAVAMAVGVPSVAQATLVDTVNITESTFAVVHGGSENTGMAWAPDGSNRLFVIKKSGLVRIVKNGSLLSTPFSSDSVFTNGECGLLGIAFDPNFVQNQHVYLFETVSATQQQLVRYTASGDVGINKTTILAGLPANEWVHNGGSIGFGPDGKLYWGIGDLGTSAGVNADLTSLAAKVGRANRDGSLPSGNPFADGAGPNNDYIWAQGFRNPFTLAVQPGTGALWVNVAGNLYEQIFVVSAGSHSGWQQYENDQPAGFNPPAVVYRTNGSDTLSLVAGTGAVRSGNISTFTTTLPHGFRKGGKITISGVAGLGFNGSGFVLATPSPTSFSFAQAGPNSTGGGGSAVTLNVGGAVTGGDFWTSSALPAAYRGNFFFGDYNMNRFERVTLASDNSVASVDRFSSVLGPAMDAAAGPDGAMYFLDFGGIVTRVSYNASAQGLVVTPLQLRMDESGRGLVTVRLATFPGANVNVSAAVSSGSPDISVLSGSALNFTAANWATPQAVQLQAAADADGLDDLSTLTLSSASLVSENVEVRVTDATPGGGVTVAAAVPATQPQSLAILGVLLLGGGLLLHARGGSRRFRQT